MTTDGDYAVDLLYNLEHELQITESDISEDEGEENVYKDYGFSDNQHRVGKYITIDVIKRSSLESEVPWHDFETIVHHSVLRRLKQLRNIVFTAVNMDNMLHRRISITKARLLRIGNDIILSLAHIIKLLEGDMFRELYEEYDQSSGPLSTDRFNNHRVLTSIVEVVWMAEEPGGAGVTNVICSANMITESAKKIYGDYDCFFDCIHQVLRLEKDLDVTAIRKKIKAWPAKEIGVKHIKRFERLLRCKITVFLGHRIGNKQLYYYNSSAQHNKPINLVLIDNHYYILTRMSPDEGGNKAKNYKSNIYKTYVFYDFETYMHPTKFTAIPYAMAYIVCNKDGNINKGVIIKDESDTDFAKAVSWFFMDLANRSNIIIVGFNNSAFDDYMLLAILSSYTSKLHEALVSRTSRILQFNYDRAISRDLYMFVNSSLREASESFNCSKTKGRLNHKELQEMVYQNREQEWICNNKDNIVDYALTDVQILMELYTRLRMSFMQFSGMMDIDRYLTLPHMSMCAFKRSLVKDKGDIEVSLRLPKVRKDIDKIIRLALVGGRSQLFAKEDVRSNYVQAIDVISLYPHVMMTNKFPIIRCTREKETHKKWVELDTDYCHHTNTYVSDCIAVYRVIIKSQPQDCIIPIRDVEGNLNWTPDHPFETWSDSVSLNCLARYGGSFEVLEGYIFTCNQDYAFKDFLEPLCKLKEQQDMYKDTKNSAYNPCLRKCLKLLMNSLSGKVGERPLDCERKLCSDIDSVDAFVRKYKETVSVVNVLGNDNLWLMEGDIPSDNIRVKTSSITSVLIYAYAREYMYDNFITKVDRKYFMDTDSLHFHEDDIYKINSSLIGVNRGQVRLELPPKCHGIYAAKKIYCIYLFDDNEKVLMMKFKGISDDDKLIPIGYLSIVQKLIRSSDYHGLLSISAEFPYAKAIQTLRSLISNSTIHVLCNQLKHSMSSTNQADKLSITHRYIIKTFPSTTFDSI